MSDLRKFVAEFRAWCKSRRLSHRYVTKEACNNSRLIEAMERQASRHEHRILELRSFMDRYDRELVDREVRDGAKRARAR